MGSIKYATLRPHKAELTVRVNPENGNYTLQEHGQINSRSLMRSPGPTHSCRIHL